MDSYTPTIKGRYVEMLLDSLRCKTCEKVMIKNHGGSVFPMYWALNQDSQMKAAGIVYMSSILVDDAPICKECAESNKADFLCALCAERKPSSQKQESFGDPAEFLCADCYDTVPARKWEDKVDQLRDEHRYDFE